jgi:hypothetical protein
MTPLNDIAKRATAERFLKAIQHEKLSKGEAGRNIGLIPAQVSYVNNEKYWDRLGNSGWDKILAWVNSSYSLKEYPKHRNLKPAEEVPPPDLPTNDDEIMEVEFEDFATERPPLGLRPREIAERERAIEIGQAIGRYGAVAKSIPPEWIEEYNEICKRWKF